MSKQSAISSIKTRSPDQAGMLLTQSLKAIKFFLSIAALSSVVLVAHAHTISPTGALTIKKGLVFDITLAGDCEVLSHVTVDDSTIVSGGGTQSAVIPVFPMTALKVGTTNIVIDFQGLGNPADCIDFGAESLTVEVVDTIDGSSAGALWSAPAKDPVNTFSGELFDTYPQDLNLGGPMPLVFQRYYASYLRRSFILGDLGSNWLHNFDAKMNVIGNNATYISNTGRVTKFQKDLLTSVWSQQDNLDTPYQFSDPTGVDVVLYDPVVARIYTFAADTLTKVEDGKGNTHTVAYDIDGKLDSVTDGLGRTLTFGYNLNPIPKISSVSDGTRTVTFQYLDIVDSEYLTTVTDARGGVTTYDYKDTSTVADHALMTSKQLPRLNVPYTQTYYDTTAVLDSGKVKDQNDSANNKFSFTYSALDTTLTDPLLNTSVFTHNAEGEFSNKQDEAGNSFGMSSDSTGRRDSITDNLLDTTTMTYHMASGKLASVTNAEGNTASNTYTMRVLAGVNHYDLTGISHADGTTESYTYDTSGNLTSATDRASVSSTITYNTSSQPLTLTNKIGGVTTYTYDTDGTRLTSRDPANNTTTYAYDTLLRPDLIKFADMNTRSYTYDAHNNILTTTNEKGNTGVYTYDANDNIASTTDPLTNTRNFTYDGNDRLLSVTASLGDGFSLTYDELGRIKTRTDANTNTITYGYDLLGRATSVTDAEDSVISRSYNSEAVITSSTNALNKTTTFISDAMGRITQSMSPLGSTVDISYDAMGRVATVTNPLSKVITFNRDARGLLSSVELPESISTSYTRNGLGQITQTTDPNGNNWQRGYDSSGRETTQTDPLLIETSSSFDNRNRAKVVTFPGGLGTLTHTYDSTGHLSQANFSTGPVLNFTHDANNRLTATNGMTQAYDANNRISNTNGIAITRDAGGRIATMILAPGKTVSYTYDKNDNVTKVNDWAGGITMLDYDANNQLTGITRPNGVNSSYGYDFDTQLVNLSEGQVSSIALTRNAGGQITSATRTLPEAQAITSTATSNQTFDAASQVSSYTYDAMGRCTDDGTRTYSWNLASHLTSYTEGGNTVSFTYDALGNRLSRSASGKTRDYVWNYALGIPSISIEKETGSDLRYYIRMPGGQLLYSLEADNTRRDYHYDEMGNTVFLTDSVGDVIASYAYSPYGQVLSSSGVMDNPFQWQGQLGVMQESDTGLYYIRARFYNSRNGRFISRDSIASDMPREVNPYQYAMANPLQFIDITGEETTLYGNVHLSFDDWDETNLSDPYTDRLGSTRGIRSRTGFTARNVEHNDDPWSGVRQRKVAILIPGIDDIDNCVHCDDYCYEEGCDCECDCKDDCGTVASKLPDLYLSSYDPRSTGILLHPLSYKDSYLEAIKPLVTTEFKTRPANSVIFKSQGVSQNSLTKEQKEFWGDIPQRFRLPKEMNAFKGFNQGESDTLAYPGPFTKGFRNSERVLPYGYVP